MNDTHSETPAASAALASLDRNAVSVTTGVVVGSGKGAGREVAALRVAGVPLAERHRRMLLALGVSPGGGLCREGGGAGAILLLRLDRLCDRRLLEPIMRGTGPAAIADDDGRIAALFLPASHAWPELAAELESPDAADLDSLASRAGAVPIRLADINDEMPAQRRRIPPRVLTVDSPGSARAASRALLMDAQNGVLDWPARFLHPIPENLLVRLLWRTRITPNHVSAATFVAGLAVMAGFATGWFWSALAGALALGVLDGVDGKLARTRLQVTPLGEWEHLADKILEYGWYLALAFGLVASGASALLILAALVAIAGMIADVAAGGIYRNVAGGRSIDAAGRVEAIWRLFAGRRNTHMWLLVPFGLADAWGSGLVAIAASAQLSALVKLMLVERRTRRWQG